MNTTLQETLLELGALAGLLLLHLWLRDVEEYYLACLAIGFGYVLAGYLLIQDGCMRIGGYLATLGGAAALPGVHGLGNVIAVLVVTCGAGYMAYIAARAGNKELHFPRLLELLVVAAYVVTAYGMYPVTGERAYLFLLGAGVFPVARYVVHMFGWGK